MKVRPVAAGTAGRATARLGIAAVRQHSSQCQQSGAQCCMAGLPHSHGVRGRLLRCLRLTLPLLLLAAQALQLAGRALFGVRICRQAGGRASRWMGEAKGQQAGASGGAQLLRTELAHCIQYPSERGGRHAGLGCNAGPASPAHHLPRRRRRHPPRCHLCLHCTAAACRQWPGWRAAGASAGRQEGTDPAARQATCAVSIHSSASPILSCRSEAAHDDKHCTHRRH